jgi:hypothetical protein
MGGEAGCVIDEGKGRDVGGEVGLGPGEDGGELADAAVEDGVAIGTDEDDGRELIDVELTD